MSRLSRRPLRRPLPYLLGLTLLLHVVGRASADDGAGSASWNPRFSHFSAWQYGVTMAGAGAMLASGTLLPASSEVHWRGDVLLDRGARNFFAASTQSGRRMADSTSDYLALGLVLYPFVVDGLLVSGVGHGNYDVAFQLAMIGLQTMVMTNLVTSLTKRLVLRARPDLDNCTTGSELECASRNESFVSGHTAAAFAGAGLICANQQNLRLYGSDVAGAVTCGLALGTATAVGTLRMVANRHHLSDVLAGAALGLATGYLLPNLTKFDFGARGRTHGKLSPTVSETSMGLELSGQF
jgi:membrane-associated phospholipid phosphatase